MVIKWSLYTLLAARRPFIVENLNKSLWLWLWMESEGSSIKFFSQDSRPQSRDCNNYTGGYILRATQRLIIF